MRITIDPARVADTFSKFSHNPSLQESAQLFTRGLPISEMIQAMSMNPNVLAAFAGFERIYPYGGLERSVLEQVILCVSRLHECQFCTESHTAITHGLGVASDLADASTLTARERVALDYSEQAVRDANRIPDALFDRLRAVFTDPEIVELTFLVGFITMLNLFNNALQVRYHGEFKAVEVR